MGNATLDDLQTKTDAAWANLGRQLQGMQPHMERSDAPGEWTTRQVLCHLLFEPGANFAGLLRTFAARDLPLVDIQAGGAIVTPERQTMTLRQFIDALEAQRQGAFAYLRTLPEADLGQRKVRIPLFKEFMGTDEISLAMFTGVMFDYHWQDHAGQLAKIRKAVGLPEAK